MKLPKSVASTDVAQDRKEIWPESRMQTVRDRRKKRKGADGY